MTNWMVKGSRVGGIYNRPIAIGNLVHFAVGAITLDRFALRGHEAWPVIVLADDLHAVRGRIRPGRVRARRSLSYRGQVPGDPLAVVRRLALERIAVFRGRPFDDAIVSISIAAARKQHFMMIALLPHLWRDIAHRKPDPRPRRTVRMRSVHDQYVMQRHLARSEDDVLRLAIVDMHRNFQSAGEHVVRAHGSRAMLHPLRAPARHDAQAAIVRRAVRERDHADTNRGSSRFQ